MTYLDPPLTHLKKSESDKKIRSKNSIGKNFRFSENRSQKSLIVTTFSEKPDFPKNGSENRKIEKSLIVTTFPFSGPVFRLPIFGCIVTTFFPIFRFSAPISAHCNRSLTEIFSQKVMFYKIVPEITTDNFVEHHFL